MIVNVIHCPAGGRLHEIFRLQQSITHRLRLKVALLIPPMTFKDIRADHETYGDELGIWMGELTGGKIQLLRL